MQRIDVSDPFRTVLIDNPDFGHSDEVGAVAALALREQMIEDLVRGEGNLDDTLDCLNDQGIDPDKWIDAVVENCNFVVDQGIQFQSNELGLFLPVR